ncbi:MAG: hypothetical protein WBK41_04575, partial [Dethiobacteria bacterium]
MINRKQRLPATVFLIILLGTICGGGLLCGLTGAGRVLAGERWLDELTLEELKSGRYFYMVDEKGETILITGRRLRTRDRFLTADN